MPTSATPDTSTFDEEANKIDSELAGAKLVTVAEPLTLRGTATVVLAPGTHGNSADVDARNTIVGALVKALARQGDGTVLVTPPQWCGARWTDRRKPRRP